LQKKGSMITEKWRWITKPGIKKKFYKVSNKGKVKAVGRWQYLIDGRRRYKRPQLMTPSIVRGYLRVGLMSSNGRQKHYSVHRLVLEAFVGSCPAGMIARHFPDKTKTNCQIDNLSWGTKVQNQADRVTHQTDSRGERNPKSKFSDEKVAAIRRVCPDKITNKEMADILGVSHRCIWSIVTNRSRR